MDNQRGGGFFPRKTRAPARKRYGNSRIWLQKPPRLSTHRKICIYDYVDEVNEQPKLPYYIDNNIIVINSDDEDSRNEAKENRNDNQVESIEVKEEMEVDDNEKEEVDDNKKEEVDNSKKEEADDNKKEEVDQNSLGEKYQFDNIEGDTAEFEVTFRHVIMGVSKMEFNLVSAPIYAAMLKWDISTKETHLQKGNERCLAVHLQCQRYDQSLFCRCHVDVSFSLLSWDKDRQHTRELSRIFQAGDSWGFQHFIKLKHLFDLDNGFIKNDSITIQVTMKIRQKVLTAKCPLSKALTSMYKSGEYSDLTIETQDRKSTFAVHRNILAARSKVFDSVFKRLPKGNEGNRKIVIEGFSTDVVREMLRYIYTDGFSNTKDLTLELRAIAVMYGLDDLAVKMESKMIEHISTENVISILLHADSYKCESVKKIALKYILDNLNTVSFCKDFEKLKNRNDLLLEALRAYNLLT